MLASENKPGAQYLMVVKAITMLAQCFLVIIILITKEEYIYMQLYTKAGLDSSEYEQARIEMIVASSVFLVILGIEFFLQLLGVSVMFLKVASFQIVFHFLGAALLLWMVIDRFQFRVIWFLLFFTALVPMVFELGALSYALLIHCQKKRFNLELGTRNEMSPEEIEERKLKAWKQMKEERKK